MPDRLTEATINLSHYRHNLSKIRELVPNNVKIMAVVKANAYGHGIEAVALAADESGTAYLGVASLGELKKIRTAGVRSPVLILSYLDVGSVCEAVLFDASLTVMDTEIIPAIEQAAKAQSKIVSVHIKIDTGMHRAGCDPNDVLSIAQKVQGSPHLQLEGVYTHFAESEAPDASFTRQQLAVFNNCVQMLQSVGIQPPLLHCANSAATISLPESNLTMVRPGLITYGLNPFPQRHEKYEFVASNFIPILSLRTQVVFIRVVERGESIGYGRTWQAKRRSLIALLPVGYGDGFRRGPQNSGHVLINGQHAPIVSNVAMDQTLVDVTDITSPISVGDEVILQGKQGSLSITANDIALACGTISNEIVTALSERVVRNFTH